MARGWHTCPATAATPPRRRTNPPGIVRAKGTIMSNPIHAFLSSKGVTEDQLKTWPPEQARSVAKAMGFKASAVRVEEYTPQQGRKGTGMYLICEGSGKPWFNRLCDGTKLTPEGRASAESLAAAILDAVAE